MIRLLTAALLVASFSVMADTEVPHTFEDGNPAKASEVNANFDALEAAIDAIPAGPAGADGADGVAAGLNCTTDQSIVYRDGAWVCSSPEYVEVADYSNFLAADCPNDKKVTAGGCRFVNLSYCVSTESKPASDFSAWICEGSGAYCNIRRVYAICQ